MNEYLSNRVKRRKFNDNSKKNKIKLIENLRDRIVKKINLNKY